jgi:hypothetical protein
MPPEHRFVKGWSKSWFIFEAGKIGPATAEAIKVIMEQKEHVSEYFYSSFNRESKMKTDEQQETEDNHRSNEKYFIEIT